MKNILILTDFSNNSWNAIMYTLAFFEGKRCNFYILNAENVHVNKIEEDVFDDVEVGTKKNKKSRLKELLSKITSSHLSGNHVFETIISEDNIIDAARHEIKNKKINLIVIGTNGMSSNGRINNISPISEEIITKLKCSILVVPNEARFNGVNKIGFPTDYTNFYEARLLQNMINFFSLQESPISFVHVSRKTEKLNKEQRWNKETLEDYFVNQPHSFHNEINENFEVSIENFIDKESIDLVVMAAKNLNLFEQILFRPKLKNIKYYFKTPFIVLHELIIEDS